MFLLWTTSAGADIIETSTYQATVGGFKDHLNLEYGKSEELIKQAVQLGKDSVQKFMSSGMKYSLA